MTCDEADRGLRAAIIAQAEAYGIAGPDEMLSEYAVVAVWEPAEADGSHRYTTQYDRPRVPAHVAAGLFRMGERFAVADDE